jgi:F-type H+-transporting ATPase subunit b
MDAIISTFHIDLKLIIAQVINFAIVLVLVYFVLGKPLIKMMRVRDSKIREGLDKADRAEKKLLEAESKKSELLTETQNTVRDILSSAEEKSKGIIDASLKDAQIQKEQILESGKKELAREKEEMTASIQKETATLIKNSLEKILSTGFTKEDNEKFTVGISKKNS